MALVDPVAHRTGGAQLRRLSRLDVELGTPAA